MADVHVYPLEEILAVTPLIIDDVIIDAAKSVPFTPLGIGTIHGELLAQIGALAAMVYSLADELLRSRPTIITQEKEG